MIKGQIQDLPPEDLEVGMKKLDIVDDALRSATERGILMPALDPTNSRGAIPKKLSELDDEALGDLLNELGQYCGWIDNQLAIAVISRNAAEAQYEFTSSRIRLTKKTDVEGKKMTAADKNDEKDCDPRVVAAKQKFMFHDAYYEIVKSISKLAQKNWETVSRNITQRGQEIERMRREGTVAGIKISSPTKSAFRR